MQTPADDAPYAADPGPRPAPVPVPLPGPEPASEREAVPQAEPKVELPPHLSPKPQRAGSTSPGLTAPGVVVVVGSVSLVALLLDVFTGGGVGWLFGSLFVVACGYAALQVRRQDLLWAVVVPPLVFAVLICSHAAFTATGDLLTKVVAGMNALLDDGPMLWLGTGLAAAIVAWRRWGASLRRARQP